MNLSRGPSTEDEEPKHSWLDDSITPWALLVLAALAGAGAILRAVGDREAKLLDRLNETTLLYLAVGGVVLLLRKIKTLSFGTYKLEMLEQIRERQVKQEDLLNEVVSKLLPLLLPDPEKNHLINLASGNTANYRGGSRLQAELRRMRSVTLIKMKKDANGNEKWISNLREGQVYNLADYVELTPLGEQWAKSVKGLSEKEAQPEGAVAAGTRSDQSNS
jgi:hypothetical protein